MAVAIGIEDGPEGNEALVLAECRASDVFGAIVDAEAGTDAAVDCMALWEDDFDMEADVEGNSYRSAMVSLLAGESEHLSLLLSIFLRVAAETGLASARDGDGDRDGECFAESSAAGVLQRVFTSLAMWPITTIEPAHSLQAKVRLYATLLRESH